MEGLKALLIIKVEKIIVVKTNFMSKIVEIKLIEKKGSSTFCGHVRYSNTKDTLSPYYDSSGILYTGLTKEEAKEYGDMLKQDLSATSDYWHNYTVVMTPKGLTLDLENDLHKLMYKFLQGHYRIAKSLSDPNIGIKDYYIVDENLEASVINTKASFKRKANQLFDKLSTENKKDILMLYPGFTNMDTVSAEIVDARLYQKLEEDPARFINLAEDKKRDLKIMLKELISADILRKNKTSYYYGQDFLGHDEESTITYLEHPDHQGLKIDLIKQLEVKGKKK